MGSRTAPDKAMPRIDVAPGEVAWVRIIPHYQRHEAPKARPAVVLRVKKRGQRATVLPFTSRPVRNVPPGLADRGVTDLAVDWWNYERGQVRSWVKADLGPVDVHAHSVSTLIGELESPSLEQLRGWAPLFADYAATFPDRLTKGFVQ